MKALLKCILYCLLPATASSQVCKITVAHGGNNRLSQTLIYDKSAKLLSITTNNSGGKAMQEIMPITTVNGLRLPSNTKTASVSIGSSGGTIVTLNGEDEEKEMTWKITLNKQGKITQAETYTQGGITRYEYTYNTNGDATSIHWNGTGVGGQENSGSEATITPIYDTRKLEVLSGGGPMTAFVRIPWQFAPMTNMHLLTGYTKTQTIHVGNITRTLNETREISYSYDTAGRISGLSYSVNKRPGKTITFSYEACK